MSEWHPDNTRLARVTILLPLTDPAICLSPPIRTPVWPQTQNIPTCISTRCWRNWWLGTTLTDRTVNNLSIQKQEWLLNTAATVQSPYARLTSWDAPPSMSFALLEVESQWAYHTWKYRCQWLNRHLLASFAAISSITLSDPPPGEGSRPVST